LIRNAWATDAIQIAGQIVGGPAWITTERYDINAKAEGGLTRLDQMEREIVNFSQVANHNHEFPVLQPEGELEGFLPTVQIHPLWSAAVS